MLTSGTSFYVPSGTDPTPTPAPTAIPPGQIFSDGFENGLGSWTVRGAGTPWTDSTVDPYSGSRHAFARQPGVSTPTYLERTFNLSAYNGGALTYARRRIGLDGADEFATAWTVTTSTRRPRRARSSGTSSRHSRTARRFQT